MKGAEGDWSSFRHLAEVVRWIIPDQSFDVVVHCPHETCSTHSWGSKTLTESKSVITAATTTTTQPNLKLHSCNTQVAHARKLWVAAIFLSWNALLASGYTKGRKIILKASFCQFNVLLNIFSSTGLQCGQETGPKNSFSLEHQHNVV